MNVLGISGLGVDPAACLVRDGKLVAMAQEERFNRLKGSFGLLPQKATLFCLEFAELTLDEIDSIVFSWDVYRYKFQMPYFFLKTYLERAPKFQAGSFMPTLAELLKYRPANVKNAIASMLRQSGLKGKIPPIEFIPHHLAHAASAFYFSGFDKSHILVIDGSGEDKCTTVFKGDGLELKEEKSFKIPNSLGWFYQSITEFLGFLPNMHEGKTMALASYGKYDKEIFSSLRKMISCDGKGDYRYDASYSFLGKHVNGKVFSEKMETLLKNKRGYLGPIEQAHKDIAFAGQKILEEIAISLVKSISGLAGYNGNICLSGGIAQNCKMNGTIAGLNYVNNIFIPPAPNDAGAALGAALYFSKTKGYGQKLRTEHAQWGPEFSNSKIEAMLNGLKIKYEKHNQIEEVTAKLLEKDKIVGWFQGRMEIGPRALGARSILANPQKNWMKDKVNLIKNRESWRPFSPSLLYEDREEYLDKPKDSPFMALAFEVPEKIKLKIPSAVHIDNTARAHLVKKEVSPRYWRLINEFKKLTSTPALLNTSFNIQGEPIVCTPQEALKTFAASKIDYLVMEDFLIYR